MESKKNRFEFRSKRSWISITLRELGVSGNCESVDFTMRLELHIRHQKHIYKRFSARNTII